MKTMTCKQLGGACDKEFHTETFEEMAELSKKHGMVWRCTKRVIRSTSERWKK